LKKLYIQQTANPDKSIGFVGKSIPIEYNNDRWNFFREMKSKEEETSLDGSESRSTHKF
jgi:hypothetical protein